MTPRVEAEIVPEAADEWATPISHHPEDGQPAPGPATAANEPTLANRAATVDRGPSTAGTSATADAPATAGASAPGTPAAAGTSAAAAHADITQIPHRGLITATVVMTSMMQALDNTIANVALPHIQGSLSATQDQMAWVLTSYIVAAAIMTPLSGWLSVRVGRRRVMLYSLIGFTVASMLCGLAHSLPEIVTARLLQGMSGAALVPLSQSILLDINPPERHAKAMAMWAMAISIGPIMGPAIGAWLTENYSWRWVFYINVPIGVLGIIGITSFVRETVIRRPRFDFTGFATLSLAVGALQLMLDRGQLKDWFSSTEICVFALVSAVSFYLFVVHLMTTKQAPFINLGVFKDRNFVTGTVFIFIIGIVMFAVLALLPPMMQELLNYPVQLTGWVMAPRGLGAIAAMFIVGRIIRVVDSRIILAAGFAIAACSLWQMTGFYLQMDVWSLFWSGILQGLGTGILYVPLASMAFGTLSPALRDEGTTLFSLIRNIGSSVGISVVITLLTRNGQIMHARLAEKFTPYIDPWHPGLVSTVRGMAALNGSITRQAQMIAYIDDFKLMMVLSIAAIPLVFLLRKPKAQRVDEPVVIE